MSSYSVYRGFRRLAWERPPRLKRLQILKAGVAVTITRLKKGLEYQRVYLRFLLKHSGACEGSAHEGKEWLKGLVWSRANPTSFPGEGVKSEQGNSRLKTFM